MAAEILRAIGRIARALDSIANVEFKDLALNRGQYLYLVRIYEQPNIILEELSQILRVDKTTASRAVNKLVAQGLVKKYQDPHSAKRQLLKITAEGKRLAEFILLENNYSELKALQGLNSEQIEQLSTLLQVVDENILNEFQTVKTGKMRNYSQMLRRKSND